MPGAACYQALVLVDMSVKTFRSGGLLPEDYQVTINPLDGEPISRELGVAGSSTPRMAFWLDFDFDVPLGDDPLGGARWVTGCRGSPSSAAAWPALTAACG